MTTLVLKSAIAGRGGGHWSEDDYDVYQDKAVIGRAMLHLQAPKGQRWFWTIVEGIPPSIHNRSYSASREQAMADFKNRSMQATVK